MKNSHTRFTRRFSVFTSLALISIIYYLSYSFTACNTNLETDLDGDHCTVADFVISLAPGNVTLTPGTSQAIHIAAAVTSDCEDIAKNLNVSLTGEVPFGISLSGCGNAPMDNNSGTCDATLVVSEQAASGSYQIELLGTASLEGGRTSVDTKTLGVTVNAPPDFSLDIASNFGAGQGLSFTMPVTITRTNGHNESISLSLDHVPLHTTHNFDPNPVSPSANTSELTITPAQSTPHGEYSIELIGNSTDLENHAIFTFYVMEPFKPTVEPESITIVKGQSASLKVRANRLATFYDQVFFTAEGDIIGPGQDLIEPVFDPNPTTEYSIDLTLIVGGEVPTGTYNVIITASFDTLLKTVELPVTVIE